MKPIYHPGALAVQEQANVAEQAGRVASIIRSSVAPAAREFLVQQAVAILGAADMRELLWASLLLDEPGFLSAEGETAVRVAALPIEGDPLAERVAKGGGVGMLAIDFATRRRLRFNGVAERSGQGFLLHVQEVFFNCPKYIQAREMVASASTPVRAKVARRGAPTEAQRRWMAEADTFFLATTHGESGADVSHRGGPPGFIRVLDDRTLLVPDYAGNTMFQTLGNLVSDPRMGLLFIDFERCRTLQATGTGKLIWEPERFSHLPGAERALELTINETVEVEHATPRRFRLVERSPFNPT